MNIATHSLTTRDESFFLYNGLDSCVLPEIFSAQMQNLTTQRNTSHYERTRNLLDALMYMQVRGVRMDTEKMKKESAVCLEEMLFYRAEFTRVTGAFLNLGSQQQVANYFYRDKKITPIRNREGGVTVDDEALKRIIIKGFDEAILIQNYRHAQKMRGTYYEMPLSPEGRLHCQFKPVSTARLSSSKSIFDYGTNMQNQPPKLKCCCLADEGYLIGEMDLSQAENRICAWAGPVPQMIEAFEEGVDIHSLTASRVLSIALGIDKRPEDVSKEKGSAPFGNREWSERDMGKRSNHALNWGMTKKMASIQWEVSESVADKIIEAYHRAYPGVRKGYHPFIQGMLRGEDKTTTNPFGRRRKFLGPIQGDRAFDTYKEAYADYAQSTVGCIINERGLSAVTENPITFGPLELLNQVHDSIWFQFPVSMGFEAAATMLTRLADSLTQPFQIRGADIVIPVDMKIGRNLGDPKLGGDARDVHLDSTLAQQLEAIWNRTSTDSPKS